MGDKPTARSLGLELLAPAGNWECARAAVANGADAIYFGMPQFNARMRADNFTPDDLLELMEFLHSHGVRGLVAFNTLIFTQELEAAADQLRTLSRAGVDAVIIQDMGLARLARILVPDLNVHASTQMTITSPEALAFVDRRIGVDRAVIGRENSLREIHLFHANEQGAVELETFVHGALCVAYSGQCLTSESLGQRSANRGECAQACRMPYELVVDGETKDMGDQRYLLSPQDLAGIDEVPQLIEKGIRSFKIEGRLKTPEYVAAVTQVYRKAIDRAVAGIIEKATDEERYQLEMVFSRGLSSGWLQGIDNKKLVHARFGKKRGSYLGRVKMVGRGFVELDAPSNVKAGDGIVFENPGDTNREIGSRVFEVKGKRLTFGKNRIDLSGIKRGTKVWKTDDPKLNQQLRKSWERQDLPMRKEAVQWEACGELGSPLTLSDRVTGLQVASSLSLEKAEKRPLSPEFLKKQWGKLGGTAYELASLDYQVAEGVLMPMGELNAMRRQMVERLDEVRREEVANRREEQVNVTSLFPEVARGASDSDVRLSVLCRNGEQMAAAIEAAVPRIYLDCEDVRTYKDLVKQFRETRKTGEIFLATPRIQKAGETGLFKVVERALPDGVLLRNLGGVEYFRSHDKLKKMGDFSLNVANPLTAKLLMEEQLDGLTVSYDLNIDQTLDLLRAVPQDWFEVTLHQHMPMFHMEHCVFCSFLSEGTDFTNCGRPCEEHKVELRDRVGQLHRLTADVGCRNTLFNGRAQTAARFFQQLTDAGLCRGRVEFLDESREAAAALLKRYQSLIGGQASPEEMMHKLDVTSRLGVVEGTLGVS